MEDAQTSSSKQTARINKNIVNKFKRSHQVANPSTHSIKKRPSSKPYQRKNDIYVSNKSNFKALLKECQDIVSGEFSEVYLHCVGNAINRGINLALALVRDSDGGFEYEANTSSIELIDDFHPLNDEEDFTIQKRMNSCLHIRIFRHSRILTKPT